MVLKKELTLYERDEEGKLIPQERKIKLAERDEIEYPNLVGQTIKVIPMTRGELKKMFGIGGKITDNQPETDKDEDANMVLQYCKDPQYTEKEIKYIKPVIIRSIVRTIFDESGVKIDDKAGMKRFDQNDDFGKNSSGLDEKERKGV